MNAMGDNCPGLGVQTSTNEHTVVYDRPQNGYDHHKATAAQHLEVGKSYTCTRVDVGDCHTDIYLKEAPGVAFNSVLFSGVQYGEAFPDGLNP